MSETAGRDARSTTDGWRGRSTPRGLAAAIAERDSGDSLLRFLSRLSAFGLAAGSEPLLKPVKPAS